MYVGEEGREGEYFVSELLLYIPFHRAEIGPPIMTTDGIQWARECGHANPMPVRTHGGDGDPGVGNRIIAIDSVKRLKTVPPTNHVDL